MKEKYLGPKEVAELMGISIGTARVRMAEMPGCINVGGGGKNKVLRVPESGIEAWASNRVVVPQRISLKIPRRHTSRKGA